MFAGNVSVLLVVEPANSGVRLLVGIVMATAIRLPLTWSQGPRINLEHRIPPETYPLKLPLVPLLVSMWAVV